MFDQTGILKLIQSGEGLNLEFKQCREKLNLDVYQTICAFLNRHGGEDPQMIEGDVFRIIVKVPEFGAQGHNGQKQVSKADTSGAQSGAQSGAHSEAQSEAQSGAQWQRMLLLLASESLSAMALAEALGLQSKTGSFKRALSELLEKDLIAYTVPDKPGSRLQKYRLTSRGYEELKKLKK
ncbi:MAG: helix-turn-helix domain-containing protein [Desulfonatronovibrio sp.]